MDVLMASVELDGFHGDEEDEPAACRAALLARLAELRRERDDLRDTLDTAGADLRIDVERPQDLITHVELLRARAEAAEAKLAGAILRAEAATKGRVVAVQQRVEETNRCAALEGKLVAAERRGDEAREALALVNAKLRDACSGSEPSAGHDYADEVIGLLRVARQQRDDAWKGEP